LVAVAGLALTATTIGRWVFKKRSLGLAFAAGAVLLRIVALVPFLGELITVGAMTVGTGALVLAWRRHRGDPEDALETAEKTDRDTAGRTADLLPGFTADLDEEPAATSAQPVGADWLDLVVAGAERPPTVDLRSPDSHLDSPDLRDPDLRDPDTRPRVFDRAPRATRSTPAGPATHEVIASLPVRDESACEQSIEEAVDGAEHTTEATRRVLFSSDPKPASHNGVPLFAPSAEGRAASMPAQGQDAAPTAPTRQPDSPIEPAPDSPLNLLDAYNGGGLAPGESDDEVRARLFLETPTTLLDNGDQMVGGLFTTGSRAWRPEHN
jgi:hypothetical protein